MKRLWILFALLLLAGILMGLAAYGCLSDGQAMELQQFLTQQLQLGSTDSVWQAWQTIGSANAMDLLRFYLAGLCLIGLPLIILLVFLRGFTFGFTALFLLHHGLLPLLTRLLWYPLLVLAAVLSCRFSLMLFQNRMHSPLRQLLPYSLYFVLLAAAMALCSYLDGFCCVHFLALH